MFSNRITVAWPDNYNPIGNYLGFATHGTKLRDAAVRWGGVTIDDDAPVVVVVGSPRWWVHRDGRKHVLSCAWECHELPEVTSKGAALADGYIVTSEFLVDVFKSKFPDKPVACCPLGVDGEAFPYVRRSDPVTRKRPFVFGWAGAANKRKGYELVAIAWEKFLVMALQLGVQEVMKPPMLYMKLNPVDEGEISGGPQNVVTDSRRLSERELAAAYHTMDAFVFPSYGEGFALGAAEAAATGLPVLYTPKTALGDIFSPMTGYPLKWHWTTQIQDEAEVQMPQADTNHLARTMMDVMLHYGEALERGKRAAQMIRRRYTWEQAGRTFGEMLRWVMARL